MSPGNISLCPARLEPIFSPRPWGARSLAPLFPEKSHLAAPLGEAWMTGLECRFASGPFAGQKLGDVWRTLPSAWTGTKISASDSSFPLLVKFIFAEEKLSVQVHPDDDFAARHEQTAGGRGKTEMWYAIRARPGAEVLAGLKPSCDAGDFQTRHRGWFRRGLSAARSSPRGRSHLRPRRHRAHYWRRAGPLRSSGILGPYLSRVRLQPPRRAGPLARVAHRKSTTGHALRRTARRKNRAGADLARRRDGNVFCRLPLFRRRKMGIRWKHGRYHLARTFRSADFSGRPRRDPVGPANPSNMRPRRPGCSPPRSAHII